MANRLEETARLTADSLSEPNETNQLNELGKQARLTSRHKSKWLN